MIHFIGLGNMGLPMAINLVKTGGEPVAVFDLSAAQCAQARDAGLKVLSADAIGGDARVLISALPSGRNVRAALIDADVGAAMRAGGLFIDCTTADIDSARALHDYARERGHDCVDAPMSGGIKGAQNAALTFMLGGADVAVARAKPYLQTMGKNIFHAGAAGAGQIAKICNNMMLAISMAGTCEALSLGKQQGLDVAVLSKIMSQASGDSWVLQRYNPWPQVMEGAPAGNGYQGGFKSALMLKDLALAENTAVNSDSSIPLGALVRSLYALHCREHGDLDFSSLLKHYIGE